MKKRVLKKKSEFVRLFIVVIMLIIFSQVSYSFSDCSITANEGDLIQLGPAAYDPDYDIGPAGILIWTFFPPFNISAEWQTKKGQRGIYSFKLSVSDGEFIDTKYDCVNLLYNNKNPVLSPVSEMYIQVGEEASISATCIDPDKDVVKITYQVNNQKVDGQMIYDDVGDYKLKISCEDDFGGSAEVITKLHVLPHPQKDTSIDVSRIVEDVILTATETFSDETEISVVYPGDDIQLRLPKPKKDYEGGEKCVCNGDDSKIFLDASCCVYATVGEPMIYNIKTKSKRYYVN